MNTEERLEFMYRGAKTRRYHTEDVLHPQNVAEHSWGVAMLVVMIDPAASKEVLLAALSHDVAEHIVGDVPAPSKRANPALKATLDTLEGSLLAGAGLGFADGLTDYEKSVVKAADIIDGMMFCVNERRRGNKDITNVYRNFSSYIHGFPQQGKLWESLRPILNAVREQWRKACQ